MAVTRAFQLLSTIVLARLLTKEEFGLIIAAMMVIQILQAFGEMGLGAAFIQCKNITSSNETSAANTLFAIRTAANTLLFGLAMLAAWQIAALLPKVEGLEPVLRWLLTMLLLNSVAGTAGSLLRKRLEFAKMSHVPDSIRVYVYHYRCFFSIPRLWRLELGNGTYCSPTDTDYPFTIGFRLET